MRRSRALIRIDRLYSQGLILVETDMKAIAKLSQYGEKLDPTPAKDLRDYLKLLADMKDAHEKMQADKTKQAKQADKAVDTSKLEEMLKAETGRPLPTIPIPPTVSAASSKDKP